MRLLDEVLDHINIKSVDYPDGFDIRVKTEHVDSLLDCFNRGSGCGYLYATGFTDPEYTILQWSSSPKWICAYSRFTATKRHKLCQKQPIGDWMIDDFKKFEEENKDKGLSREELLSLYVDCV